MATQELQAYRGVASYQETQHYQMIVGTILYAAIITRPDVAFVTSRLADTTLIDGEEAEVLNLEL